MPIAVDAMGGDFAPQSAVEGAVRAAVDDQASILLVGDRQLLEAELARHPEAARLDGRIAIVHAEEVVGMDEPAITPIRKKRRSSIRICAEVVKDRRAQAMVTAGNTGAAMIAAKMVIGTLPGVDRPALAAVFPNPRGHTVVLDVGANVDSKPDYLVQFAAMGAIYAREMLGRAQPRVALLSNGEEEGKGDELVRETTRRLRGTLPGFIGNVEPKDIFAARADVIVADGFVGNVAIKMAEATADFLFRSLRDEIPKTLTGKVGGALIRPRVRSIRDRIDWREFGGAPLLGIDGVAVIAHGRSDARAMKNAIRVTRDAVQNGLVAKIRAEVGRA
jgi:phosphate acyltransferase